jgi:hypothetical protein
MVVQTLEDGIGTDFMLFSIGLVLPVSGYTYFLWFCPVAHAIFLTIAQRHWSGGRRGGDTTIFFVEFSLMSEELRLMTSNELFGRSIRFVLFVSAFPGFSLGMNTHGLRSDKQNTSCDHIQVSFGVILGILCRRCLSYQKRSFYISIVISRRKGVSE